MFDTIPEYLDFLLGEALPAFIHKLSSLQIVSGVSLLSFIIALAVLIIVIGSIIYRA